MSNTATPGQDYTFTATINDVDKLELFMDGSAVGYSSLRDLGNDEYEITIAGVDVDCPGPFEAKEDGVLIHKADVSPCP